MANRVFNQSFKTYYYTIITLCLICLSVSFIMYGCNKPTPDTQGSQSDNKSRTDSMTKATNNVLSERNDSLFDSFKLITPDSSKTSAAKIRRISEDSYDKINSNLKKIFSVYLDIKNELTDNDSTDAQKKARDFLTSLEASQREIGDKNLDKKWNFTADKIKKITNQIDSAVTLASQRTLFNKLSESMLDVIKEYGIEGKTVYQLTCSDALAGKGGLWLTDNKDADNPYYGKKSNDTKSKSCIKIVNGWKFN